MSIKLLKQLGKYAIIQQHDRRFPGVSIQGDTLHTMLAILEVVQSRTHGEDESCIEFSELVDELRHLKRSYEEYCSDNQIGLPY